MPTLSGTLQIHAPLNWLFDSDKLTLCLSSSQRAIGSTLKGLPNLCSKGSTRHKYMTWRVIFSCIFCLSISSFSSLLCISFVSVSASAQPASWVLAVPGAWRQHFPTSKVHIDSLNLQSVLSVKIIHIENIREYGEGLTFRISRTAACNTVQ